MSSQKYPFKAYHLTKTLKLKDITNIIDLESVSKSATSLVFKHDDDGFVFVYRFGSVVFFNVEKEKQLSHMEKVRSVIAKEDPLVTTEDFWIEVGDDLKSSVGFEHATTDALALDRIEMLALVIAESAALEYFELYVDEMLDKSNHIVKELESTGRMTIRGKRINKFMGFCMTTKQSLVSSLYLLDKPDEIWEDPLLEKLHKEASETFELRERYRTVEHKLKMLQDDLGIISELIHANKAALLEITIIVLIAIEVVLFIWDIFK